MTQPPPASALRNLERVWGDVLAARYPGVRWELAVPAGRTEHERPGDELAVPPSRQVNGLAVPDDTDTLLDRKVG